MTDLQETAGSPYTFSNVNDPAEGIVNPEQTIVSTKMLMTGWWQKKYVPINVWKNKEAKTYSLYSVFTDNANDDYVFANTQDLVLIRFADVLLMHSELTQTPDGMNTVRKRAGLKPLPAYSLEALQRERLYELFAESSRYYDLLRWYGKEAGAVIDRNQNGVEVWNCGTKDKINFNLTERIRATGGFLQISQKEINLSGGVHFSGYDRLLGIYNSFSRVVYIEYRTAPTNDIVGFITHPLLHDTRIHKTTSPTFTKRKDCRFVGYIRETVKNTNIVMIIKSPVTIDTKLDSKDSLLIFTRFSDPFQIFTFIVSIIFTRILVGIWPQFTEIAHQSMSAILNTIVQITYYFIFSNIPSFKKWQGFRFISAGFFSGNVV